MYFCHTLGESTIDDNFLLPPPGAVDNSIFIRHNHLSTEYDSDPKLLEEPCRPKLKETIRLEESRDGKGPWKKWGPYLSERQWGTVREDYSDNGDAWDYFRTIRPASGPIDGERTG